VVWRSEGAYVAVEASKVMILKNRRGGAFQGSGSIGVFGQILKEKGQWSEWIDEQRRKKIIPHLLCSTPEAKK
jgi:hypothetical protein